ncbi:hypothetical protein IHE45_14G039300 [Dioscorea alata]|uniref:Uncharacterized protein n=1 Tax=Dioscorea alata TaxID=55571 RepID=A0ACB7URF6_DIOAL|nr:hypothetical protein IHE45_14G039300 [Dioscorea alata]
MSRCFPYLHPNREAEALIEPIKLQNGKESRKEKKDRRKEKNREKKDKKENRKRSREDHGSFEPSKHSPKKRKHDEGKGFPAKAVDDGSEQLEKSSITEELGLPLSTYSPYDSDRSQNTKQRENPAATAPSINHNNVGFIVRVRLPLGKKQKDAEALVPNEEDPCFSGRLETPFQSLHFPSSSQRYSSADQSETVSNQEAAETMNKPFNSQQRHSGPSGRVEETYKQDVAQPNEKPSSSQLRYTKTPGEQKVDKVPASAPTPSTSNQRLSRIERKEQRYQDLVSNWNPQQFQYELSDDSEDNWLFGSRQGKDNDAGCKTGAESSVYGNTTAVSFQPRACYIPEMDMHALPFVVPF